MGERIRIIEVAKRAGIGRAAVSNWRKRYEDFPRPFEVEGGGELFDWNQIQAFMARNDLPRIAAIGPKSGRVYVLLRNGEIHGKPGSRSQIRLALIEALLRRRTPVARKLAESILTNLTADAVECDDTVFEIRMLSTRPGKHRISAPE